MPKKKLIENLKSQVDNIKEILEKIKILSTKKDNNRDEFIQILEEEIVNSMHEINNILLAINQSLDDLK